MARNKISLKTVKIAVSADNIENAKSEAARQNSYTWSATVDKTAVCPVTRAFRGVYTVAHENVRSLTVPFTLENGGAYALRLVDKFAGQTHDFPLPSRVTKFLSAYDEGKSVKPFSFKVALPTVFLPNVETKPTRAQLRAKVRKTLKRTGVLALARAKKSASKPSARKGKRS